MVRQILAAALIVFVGFLTAIQSSSVPAQQSDDLETLQQRVQQLDQAGKYTDALAVQRRLAALIEKAELADAGHPGQKTAVALAGVAWYALLTCDFEQALAASERAHALSPSDLVVETNRAHSLLLSRRIGEARSIYLTHKGKPVFLISKQLWEDVVADDFEALRKVGVDDPALAAISVELGGKSTASQADLDELDRRVGELDRAGNYKEGEAIAEKYVALARERRGESHPKFATAISWLGFILQAQGRNTEAEPLLQHALAIDEKVLGPDHAEVGNDLNNLAELYRAESRFAEAEPLYKRSLSIAENVLGPDHPGVATELSNLALLYEDESRYAEAEQLLKRALAIDEKALGPDHLDTGRVLSNLGVLYSAESRDKEAEPLLNRALAIDEKALGPDHPDVGRDLRNIADQYKQRGRYAEAEPLYKRALSIAERTFGSDHPNVGSELDALAQLYHTEGRYADAEQLYKRSLAIGEKVLGPDQRVVATGLNNIAELYRAQGRYAEAEPLYKRALEINEKVLGSDHRDVGRDLNNLALLYDAQGRYTEAEPLYKRALTITETTLGPEHPSVAIRLNNLGTLYLAQGRYTEAEPLFKRSLVIAEKALGADHPDVARELNNLAVVDNRQDRKVEAETLYKRALAIDEKAFGPDSPTVATDLNNVALLYVAQFRYAEAEPLMRRALEINEKALGPDHPDVGQIFSGLAGLYFFQGDWDRSVGYWRRSTDVVLRRAQRGTLVQEALTGRRKSEAAQQSWQFEGLVKAAYRLTQGQHDDMHLLRDMFQSAQWARGSEAAASLAQMAARGAKGDPKLAELVRDRQDLVTEWQRRDTTRNAAIARAAEERDHQAEAENVARLITIDSRITEIDKRLTADFPDYAALESVAPLAIDDVQKKLGADEALLLFFDTPASHPTPEETFIWVVTKTGVRWVRSKLGTPALAREVSALRCGLDYQGSWFDEKGVWNGARCNDLLNTTFSLWDYNVLHKPLPFDLGRSYSLYKALFDDVEDLIKDKRLLIVPSGPLTQLPFQVLVTKPANTALPATAADYRDVPWLVREHAISVLPAVSSLKAVRELAKDSHSSEKYIGFGNPLLDGDAGEIGDEQMREKNLADARLARDARCEPTQPLQAAALANPIEGGGRVTRGPDGLVEIADLRKWPPLPETAEEVCGVASILGVDSRTHVYIGEDAREATVKRLSDEGELAKYQIVHFATHGALAGQLSPAAEPGLILTPPDKASEVDDGYLSASEVAALKLDADWVILSACNTAAGEEKSAEALSGLARAFFYAGSRSLLVSHWYVASKTAVPLITTAIAMLAVDPKIGRAEALRQSMLSMIENGNRYEAHPAFWAPFVLVGEGGAAR
jgi:tetratricopeptide (TPR) repeat protein/CHAT domain-containing protein